MQLRLLAALALLTLGCAHAEQPVGPVVGQPFELGVGEAVTLSDTGLTVRLVGVQEDSRCPARVTCIWAGRVVLDMELQAPDQTPTAVALATCCGADEGRVAYAGQVIELQSVVPPPPDAGTALPRESYRATLLVAPGS